MTYEESLALLSAEVGSRNTRLVSIAMRGRRIGKGEDEIVGEIISAGGEPRLTESEVRRAVKYAFDLPFQSAANSLVGGSSSGISKFRSRKHRRTPPSPSPTLSPSPTPSPSPIGFVREMIALGGGKASSRDLLTLSRVPIADDPAIQAVHFLLMLEEPECGLYFVGHPRMKRTRDRLVNIGELQSDLVFGDLKELPTHILPNDLTGESAQNDRGEESYALEKCLKHRRYAVVEFDEMPLSEQAAFWKGTIESGLLPVRALVYSGGKSIHGLLRLDESKDYREQWRQLEAALASDADKAYRCDLAFRNAAQMMRFPGAIRPETNRRQCLLYLDS